MNIVNIIFFVRVLLVKKKLLADLRVLGFSLGLLEK